MAPGRRLLRGVELLETRRMLAAVSWTGMGNGTSWTDRMNWSTQAVPGPSDDVTIDIASNANLNISSGAQAINSLVCDDKLFLFSSVTLQVATTITLGSNSSEDFVNRGLNLEGATLVGGAYSSAANSGAAINVINGSNAFNDVSVSSGVVNVGPDGGQAATLTILNNLTMSASVLNLSASNGGGATVNFGDPTHAAGSFLGTANVTSQGPGGFIQNASGLTGAAGTLTIAAGVSIASGDLTIQNTTSTGTIVNQGSITGSQQFIVNSGTAAMTLGGTNGQFINQGTVDVTGGTMASDNFVNQSGGMLSQTGGTVTLQNFTNDSGGTFSSSGPNTQNNGISVTFTGTISNLGTMSVTNVTVNLAGDFSQADLGTLNRSGGTVNVTGTVEGNLTLDSSTGQWNILSGAALANGTLTQNDGVTAGFAPNGGILEDETINGDFNLTLAANGSITVIDSLTVTGNLVLGNASGTTSVSIYLGTGAQNFGSTSQYANTQAGYHISDNTKLTVGGQIIFGASQSNAIFNENIHIIPPPGPNDPPAVASYDNAGNITYFGGSAIEIAGAITGGRGSITNAFSRSSIQIDTSLTADGANSAMQVGSSPSLGVVQDTLINNGTFQATNGASLILYDLNQTTGTVSVTNSALRLAGTLANGGTITATNSSVDLNGTFSQTGLGTFNPSGSTVTLSGTLEGGLSLDANTGSWFLYGGTIDGGTVTESDGAELAFTHFGGSFGTSKKGVTTHVTFDGDMDFDAGLNPTIQSQSETLKVVGGLTLNGTMFLGNAATSAFGAVYFGDNVNAPGSLTGNGTVVFAGANAGGNSLANGWQGQGSQTFTIGPSIAIRGGSGSLAQINGTTGNTIVLQGAISADVAGATIQLGTNGPVINQGSIQAINGGAISGVGLINSPGRKITVTGSTLNLSSGWSNAGTIVATNSTLNLAGSFTRATLGNFVRTSGTVNIIGTLSGGLNLDAANGSWTLRGGIINGGSINTSGGSQLILNLFGGTLAGVTVNGNVDATAQSAQARFTGGLVLNGTITMGAGNNSATLYFGGQNVAPGTISGNGTIVFAGTNGNSINNDSGLTGASGTLTIGQNITIEGNSGAIHNDLASGTIVNQGTIIADVSGGTISIGGTFSNQGTMQANGGGFSTLGQFNIDGLGTLSTNWAGSLSLGGNLSGSSTAFASSNPQGVITLNGGNNPANPQLVVAMSQDLGNTAAGFKHNFVYGTIDVAADVKIVDQFHNSPGSADALYVNSILVNTFETLDLNGIHVYARAIQNNGTVINGTITQFPDGGPIDINSPLPGEISPAGNQDTWTFFGRAGEAVTAYVNPGTGNAPAPISPNLNFASIQLVAPDNSVLASGNSASPGAAVSLPNVRLPTDGVYSIKISAAAGHTSATGNYDVAVWDVTPSIQPLLLGQTTTGSIHTPFDIQQWTFTALANEQVKFHLVSEASSGLVYSLTGPNGFTAFTNISGDSSLIVLPSNGTYTLSVQGANGATGNYAFAVIPSTLNTLSLFGSINGLLEGPGQAELYMIAVPTVQVLTVTLNDSSDAADSNEMYLKLGSPPTRESYDDRYTNANSADQTIVIPSAAVGTWYVLVYSDNVPVPSSFTLSARGDSQRLTGLTPTALGNSAPETIEITGAGFQPGSQVALIGPGNTQISPTTTSVISYTKLSATFAAGLAPGIYSVKVTQGANSDTLNNVFTVTAGGSAHLQTGLQLPAQLGRHIAATLFVTYSNTGTVAMPAPLLELSDSNPLQQPLLTLDRTKIAQGLWTSTLPEGYSNSLSIIASGAIPGVLLPGETITVPVYYAGMQQPWDFVDASVPMTLGVLQANDTGVVDWASMKASLQPPGVSNAAWNQIYSNLTSQLGNTWGQFVTALDNNAAYLGSLGENVTDFNTLWGFMYAQANDALGPVEHLQTVFDASIPLPNGGSLSFWRNYHLPISGRFATGMLGNGWSVPYQSTLVIDPSGDAQLQTVGEAAEIFQQDTRGGFFKSDDGNSLVANADGTHTITAPNGESDTYAVNGSLQFHSDAQGDVINFVYDGSGRLISLTASTGQSITLSYNAAGLLGTLTTSTGDVVIYNYDATNHFLTSVSSVEGTTTYGYNAPTNELTSIQNADGSFTNLSYDSLGRLLSLNSQTASLTLSYEQPGEISGTDALDRTTHAFYNESGELIKSIDALGNPTYFTYDDNGNPLTITDAVGDSFQYKYDANGNLTSFTDPLGSATEMTYTAQGLLASYTDANNNVTRLSYGPLGTLSAIAYPDGTQEQFTLNNLGEATSIVDRSGQAINYTYDGNGNVTKETFADGSHDDFTYDGLGELLTATDSTGTTTFTYTPQGSLASVTYPDGKSLTYTYNALGQLSQRVDQSGYTLNFAYDSAGRPWKLLDGSNQPIATYSYNAFGDLTEQDNANGTFTTYGYDADGNVLNVINHDPGGAVSSEFDATYNLLNQMVAETTPDGSWSYTYDAGGQLTRAVFTSTNPNVSNQDLAFNYDAAGNRTSTIINGVTTDYTVNSMNEYTSIGGITQQYDANGNLVYDGTTTYTYNPLNQLTGFSNAQDSSQFTYNALGQRVNSTVNGVFTEFLNDPNDTGTPTAEYDANGQLLMHFNQGQGIASQTTAGGANYFYDVDITGSIAGLTDNNGTYVNRYSYLPFGQLLSASGSVSNPFQFAGRQMVQTDVPNLFSMGVREYSPMAGRFLSTDPLQIVGGNWNFYTYAYNQPLQLVDPSGLKALNPHEGEPWTIAHGIPIIPPQTIYDAMGGASAFKTDSFPDEPPSDFDAAKEAGGPFTETIEDALHIIVTEQRLPTKDELLDHLEDHAFDALNKGPLAVFQVGTILKMLCDPQMAVNIGNGILGIERAHLCGTINGYEAQALVEIGMAPAGCANAPGVFGPKVPANAAASGSSAIAGAVDPNDKIGPGFGPDGFVQAGAVLPYRIDFENDPSATAPAQQVVITDQLNSNLDWSTFRIADVGWGDLVITAPANSQQFQTTVPMTYNGQTFNVVVNVGINLATGLITSQFFSIDPTTQLPPDVLTGFLPPEDGTGRGMGHVNYTVSPTSGLATGTQIRNVADVSFDEQPIIATDQVSETDPTQGNDPAKEALVTIDAGPPTSSVAALPAQETTPSFTVSWSGSDDAGGSGIATFDVFVSIDGGEFVPFITGTTAASATFNGAVGHSYGFYSVATDNVGNRQPTPASAQTSTTVVTQTQLIVSSNGDSGAGTLRQALMDANNSSGSPHTIEFHLPAGSQTITLASPLPTAADPVALSLDATQNVALIPSAGADWTDNQSLSISGSGSISMASGIEGAGDLSIVAGSSLTASHIMQGALVIGGTAGSPAIVTIAASDSAGNPLIAPVFAATNIPKTSAAVAGQSAVATSATSAATAASPSALVVAIDQISIGALSDESLRQALAAIAADAASPSAPEPMGIDAVFGGAPSRLDSGAVAAIMDESSPFAWSADDRPDRASSGISLDDLLWDGPSSAL